MSNCQGDGLLVSFMHVYYAVKYDVDNCNPGISG